MEARPDAEWSGEERRGRAEARGSETEGTRAQDGAQNQEDRERHGMEGDALPNQKPNQRHDKHAGVRMALQARPTIQDCSRITQASE